MSGYKGPYLIFVPVDYVDIANQIAAELDPYGGGSQTFKSCRMSADGQEPATHLCCSVMLKDSVSTQLPDLRESIPGSEYYFETTPTDAFNAMNLVMIEIDE